MLTFIRDGNETKVKELLEQGCDVNELLHDEWPALMIACDEGQINIARMLIEKESNVNFSDSSGNSPVSIAAMNRNVALLELLKNNQADFIGANNQFKEHRKLGIISSIQAGKKAQGINAYNQTMNLLLQEKLYLSKDQAKFYIKKAGKLIGQAGIDAKIIAENIKLLVLSYPKLKNAANITLFLPAESTSQSDKAESPSQSENSIPASPVLIKAF